MIPLSGNFLHRWLLPLGTVLVFLVVLLFCIPYSQSLGDTKEPLGILVWRLGTSGGTTAMDYSYCLFVPLIVGYLVFIRKEKIAGEPVQGSNAAMGLIVFGLLLYWLGTRAELQYIGYVAVQLLLAGVILWLWGWAVFRKLLFPWAFLAFLWPLPFLEPIVAFPLRMVMSHMATVALNIIGIPSIQNGTGLLSAADPVRGLPVGARFEIDIADPCSGLRSLFALLMCSALYSYLFLPKLWQQWLVFLSAFPLAIVGNLVRVLMLTIGSILFGAAFAIGPFDKPSLFHEAAGFVVFAVALGSEFILGYLLTTMSKRFGKQRSNASSTVPAAKEGV